MQQKILAVLKQAAAVFIHSCDPLFPHESLATAHFVVF